VPDGWLVIGPLLLDVKSGTAIPDSLLSGLVPIAWALIGADQSQLFGPGWRASFIPMTPRTGNPQTPTLQWQRIVT
jgi:hypothetical protein